jgi:ABC-type Co2+ transport system permease subunit
MGAEHLLLFGFVEGFVTAGVMYYFIKNKDESLKIKAMEDL